MTLPYPIVAAQTDAKSPVDDALMDAIRLDLDYLNSTAISAGNFDYQFKANGYLNAIPTPDYNRFDGALVGKSQTFSNCQIYLEKPGNGGTISCDVRAYSKPDALITSIARQFSSAINSIARAGSGINTQSISRATAQVNTQTVTLFKSALSVASIVLVGDATTSYVRYNFTAAVDSDWVVGDTVTFASSSNVANDGSFVIVQKNVDGGNNVVVVNASGVAQSGAAGTGTLRAYKYNLTNPAATPAFTVGENGHFASHPDAGNNGDIAIYAVNSGGNNVVVKNPSGVVSAVATGTVDTNRFIYAYSSSVSTTDYVVEEKALLAGHTSGASDGSFTIKLVNSGGNNLHLYIPSGGVTQGGAAGTANTNRWTYFFSVDPASSVTAGDTIIFAGATTAANNGEFVVKQVDRTTSDNVVVYNTSGVAQGGAVGTAVSKLMLISFGSDQSASITTASRILISGSIQGLADGDYTVSQVNRGGGSNYNAVVSMAVAVIAQAGACGRVVAESKSIFDTVPSIVIPPNTNGFFGTHLQISSNMVLNATRKTVAAGTILGADIISIPGGAPKNLVVQLL